MKPFLRIARPHNGHFLALEDLSLLMEQVNTKSQAPGRINDGNVKHTPTRKTGVSPTLDLRHTFLYLTPLHRWYDMRMTRGDGSKYQTMHNGRRQWCWKWKQAGKYRCVHVPAAIASEDDDRSIAIEG